MNWLTEFKLDYTKGKYGTEILPTKPTDLEPILRKNAINDKKVELQKQIQNLRTNKGLLKDEYEHKKRNLQEKWEMVEKTPMTDHLPNKAELELMVGITEKKVDVKTLKQHIVENKSPEKKAIIIEENKKAEELVAKMKVHKKELRKNKIETNKKQFELIKMKQIKDEDDR